MSSASHDMAGVRGSSMNEKYVTLEHLTIFIMAVTCVFTSTVNCENEKRSLSTTHQSGFSDTNHTSNVNPLHINPDASLPTVPPWVFNSRRRRHAKTHGKQRRTKNRDKRPGKCVCKEISNWSSLTSAEDMWGNNVEVASHIEVDGARVVQYFYETFCSDEGKRCTGIQKDKYFSSCKTKYTWSLANFARNGQFAWNYIKIRGGCRCEIKEKEPKRKPGEISILDLFGK